MASKSDYKEFINKDNKQNCTAEALDLIEKLICLDPVKNNIKLGKKGFIKGCLKSSFF